MKWATQGKQQPSTEGFSNLLSDTGPAWELAHVRAGLVSDLLTKVMGWAVSLFFLKFFSIKRLTNILKVLSYNHEREKT